LTKKAWEEKLFREIYKETYHSKFEGESAESITQVKTNLEKQQGDTMYFGMIKRLQTAFILGSSGSSVEGNEDKIEHTDFSLTLEEYKMGVRARLGVDAKRAMFSITEESRMALMKRSAEALDDSWLGRALS
jgi:hypothetical protein